MTAANARVFEHQEVLIVPHVSLDKEAWKIVARGVTNSAGNAGGTTLVDTGADSGGADTYVGRYWVRITSGANKGQSKMVSDDDGSGTLTFEGNGFDSQVASGVSYEILLCPMPVVVVDSSGSATSVVDDYRDEADDYWNGMYLFVVTGSNAGEVAEITDFTSSTGTFTLASSQLSSALSAGDICWIAHAVDCASVEFSSLTNPYQARIGSRNYGARGDGTIGPKGGTVSIQTQIIPSGTIASSGLQKRTHLWPLLQAGGLEPIQLSAITADHTSGASTTSQLEVATGTVSTDLLGAVIGYNGNYSVVTDYNDGLTGEDSINISPALPVAPGDTETINVMNVFRPATDKDVLGCSIIVNKDGYRCIMTGCKGNVTLTAGEVPTLDFSLNVDHFIEEFEDSDFTSNRAYSTTAPVLQADRMAWVDTTRVNIGGFTATPGTEVSARAVAGDYGINGRTGFQINRYNSTATFREILEDGATLSQLREYEARTERQIFILYGNQNGHVAVVIPSARRIEAPMPTNADGIMDVASAWEAFDKGYVQGAVYPKFILAID